MKDILANLTGPTMAAKLLDGGSKVLGAIVILVVGYIIMRLIMRLVTKAIGKTKMDHIVQSYLKVCIKALIWIVIILSVLSAIGVPTTSLIAILGAAGAAIALALQNSLSNLAGGILIILNKPFKQGDLIEAQGEVGVVEEIHLWNCRLHTPGNKDIIIPNGSLFNGNIVNCSANVLRRVEISVGIAYGSDIDKARDVLKQIAADHPLIAKDKPVTVGVNNLGDSAIVLDFMVWAKPEDYWTVYYYMNEEAVKRLPVAGVNIPFPQLDVHMVND